MYLGMSPKERVRSGNSSRARHRFTPKRAVVYDTRLFFRTFSEHEFLMIEINPIVTRIKEMQGRTDALRGYL
ncbi:hypothetical protein SAMN03097708_01273 [Thiohalomonas denitrificans]|uniref:Uncharacterized protein n=1 Tax=Thiohalomonas denitrificans TaxID=415747 RepID=A0A1G5Q2S0_9GAMM|nr:hypothetical protein SAMN03097708_01273 [Thiohalomonas denitrificans]